MNYTWKFSWLLQKEHAVFENNFYQFMLLSTLPLCNPFNSLKKEKKKRERDTQDWIISALLWKILKFQGKDLCSPQGYF